MREKRRICGKREKGHMTLAEIKKLDKDIITPDIAADVLECDPQYIRVAAHQRPELLGFPVTLIGRRVKIPRLAFIRYMEGTLEEGET